MKRLWVCVGLLSLLLPGARPATAAVSEAYIFSLFNTVPPPSTGVPLDLTGTDGVRLYLDGSGVATGAVDVAANVVVPVGLSLSYASHTGSIDVGEPGAGTGALVDSEAKILDDVGFQDEGPDAPRNVDFEDGACVVWDSPATSYLVIAEDAGLDVFRLEFNDGGGFVVLFDGLNAATQTSVLGRADFGTDDSSSAQIDQFYVFFFDAPLPAGQFKICETDNIAKTGQSASQLLEIDFVGIVPEPTTGFLVVAGLASFALLRRRR